MNNKIGIAVCTYNRQNFFEKCIASIPEVDSIVVINDGVPYPNDVYPSKVKEVIQHARNKSVCLSKNEALRFLVQDGCDHIFLCEDDIIIQTPEICDVYIRTAEASGCYHLGYQCHGSYNRNPQTYEPVVKNTVAYENGIKLDLYHNCLGAWSYYLRGVIKHVGYYDEHLNLNCCEHLEHTYRIIKAGLHPPWWWFADAHNSWELIHDQDKNYEGSAIRRSPEWQQNFNKSWAYFKHLHGMTPTEIPDTDPNVVLQKLETIEKNYARKNPTTKH